MVQIAIILEMWNLLSAAIISKTNRPIPLLNWNADYAI